MSLVHRTFSPNARMFLTRSRLLPLGALVLVIALLIGGLSIASSPVPTLQVNGMDFRFSSLNTPIYAGYVNLSFKNTGSAAHQVNIARLHDGVTYEVFEKALTKSPDPNQALSLVDFYGGDNTIDPGMNETVTLNLPAGFYEAICFVQGTDNIPHFAKGMITRFQVQEAVFGQIHFEPSYTTQVGLTEFRFIGLPSHFQAGLPVGIKVTNQGGLPHELTIVQLGPNVTADQVMNFFAGKSNKLPAFKDVGGMGALSQGKSGWFTINLPRGRYLALCFIPVPNIPHFMRGMSQEFTVA